jgi:cell division protein FtsI/penicillin-binding protein 2
MIIKRHDPTGWRDYQKRLKRDARRKYLKKNAPAIAVYSAVSFLMLVLVFCLGSWILGHLSQASLNPSDIKEQSRNVLKKPPTKDPADLLKELDLDSAQFTDHFEVEKGGKHFDISSSLDLALQEYILRLLRRSKTVQAAVVVLRPDDGRILAMVNYDKAGNGENLCVKADFPAASIFKIVSAAAALESAGYTPEQPVFFQGRKHTLYKQQLKKTRNKYTNQTTFRKAFASSVNSVFGKLGIFDLGQDLISEYASRFLFNRVIPFDFPVAMSTIQIPEDDYGLAEIASGFNRNTLISPLHAALLASVVANNGILMTPWLVEKITSESGEILYHREPAQLTAPISLKTAESMKVLMQDTVVYGTCRKSFRPLRRKKAFKGIDFGAKTGTINDRKDKFKYDWLASYILPQNGTKAISIAVLAIHGEKLGLRSSVLGRYIIRYYLTS